MQDITIPYLTRMGVPVSGAWQNMASNYFTISPRPISLESDIGQVIFSDPEFLSILETRYGFMVHTADAYDNTIEAVERTLERIESSINR